MEPNSGPAPYIDGILNRQTRSAISKLRMGTLPIAIETGRYVNKPVDERLCRYCNYNMYNVIENEWHFVYHCPYYDILRQSYIQWDHGRIGTGNFIEIFADINRTRQLGRYLTEAMLTRK